MIRFFLHFFSNGDFVLLSIWLLIQLLSIAIIFHLIRRLHFFKFQVKSLKEKIVEDKYKDPVTGLYNYRYIYEQVKSKIETKQPFVFIKIDLDFFNNINSIYGAEEGDNLLREIGAFFRENVRFNDIVGRFGSDDFGIILNDCLFKMGLNFARRLQYRLASNNFYIHNHKISVLANMAILAYPQHASSYTDVFILLDKCLARSKQENGEIITPYRLRQSSLAVKVLEQNSLEEMAQRIIQLENVVDRTIMESIIALANAIKAKDLYTADHVQLTVRIALEIAKALNLEEQEIELIKYAAWLHDLGKVGIPENILYKPGPLDNKEYRLVQKHPVIGADILRPMHGISCVVPLVLAHHERYDGKGYPYGIKQEEIPLGARIISIADIFQALTSNRPYRKAYSIETALKIMEEDCVGYFDPKIFKTFKNILVHSNKIPL